MWNSERYDRLLVWSGWLLIAYTIVQARRLHGERWEFGRYFMPVAALSEDGVTYLDGTQPSAFIAGRVESDSQPEFNLAVTFVFLAMFAYAFYLCRDTAKKREQMMRNQLILDYLLSGEDEATWKASKSIQQPDGSPR